MNETITPIGFQADAKVLRDAIARVTKAAPSRASVEILGGLRVESDGEGGDCIVISATDMALTLRERVPVEGLVHEGEAVILNAAKLHKGLATLDGQLTFTADADVLAVRNGTTTLRFPLGPVADYPASPFTREKSPEIAIDREAFLEAFERVAGAASREQSRPVLCGMKIEPADGRLWLIATDSYRLAVDSFECETGEFAPITVNAADLGKVVRLAAKSDRDTLYLCDTKEEPGGRRMFYVRDGERTSALRAIDGQFPNWRQLIPDQRPCSVELETAATVKAMSRMDKLAQRNAPVRLARAKDGILATIGDYDMRGVNAIESELAGTFTGEWLASDLGLNPGFFGQAVEAIGGETVRVHAINPLRPVLVTEPHVSASQGLIPERFVLVMPIRLAG